jgi:hypothetical protein
MSIYGRKCFSLCQVQCRTQIYTLLSTVLFWFSPKLLLRCFWILKLTDFSWKLIWTRLLEFTNIVWVVNATPRPDRFTPGGCPRIRCVWVWVGHRASLDGCRKSRLHRHSIPLLSSLQCSRYTDWAISAHYISLYGTKGFVYYELNIKLAFITMFNCHYLNRQSWCH